MKNPTTTACIKTLLTNRCKGRPNADLAALYSPTPEVQVHVDRNERAEERWTADGHRYTAFTDDRDDTWKDIRIPYAAKTDPHYEDREPRFSLVKHGDRIGMSGWDWMHRESRWVGFDIDAAGEAAHWATSPCGGASAAETGATTTSSSIRPFRRATTPSPRRSRSQSSAGWANASSGARTR